MDSVGVSIRRGVARRFGGSLSPKSTPRDTEAWCFVVPACPIISGGFRNLAMSWNMHRNTSFRWRIEAPSCWFYLRSVGSRHTVGQRLDIPAGPCSSPAVSSLAPYSLLLHAQPQTSRSRRSCNVLVGTRGAVHARTVSLASSLSPEFSVALNSAAGRCHNWPQRSRTEPNAVSAAVNQEHPPTDSRCSRQDAGPQLAHP